MSTRRAYRIPALLANVLLVFLLVSHLAVGGGRAAGAEGHPSEPVEVRFLREAESKIDRVYLMTGDSLEAQLERVLFDPEPILDKAGDIARKGPEAVRARAVALMAKVKRIVENDPEAALETVARVLLDKARRRAWEKAFAEARVAALEKWKEDCRQARRDRAEPPARPERVLFAPFPSVREWSLVPATLRAAVEAGLCLLALNDRQGALEALRAVGVRHQEDVYAILTQEGGGDAFMMPGGYAKAVNLYTHAIKVCRHCIGYLDSDADGEIRHLLKRIETKLAEARRLADIEAYGPGYCAYRRCQRLRCADKAYLEAYLAYEDLAREFPNTVFSAAAGAYGVKCLLALADEEEARKAEALAAGAEAACEAGETLLREANAALRRDRALRQALLEKLAAMRKRAQRLRGVPLGARAYRQAERNARARLRDEWGLYGGEILTDLATYAFERELDPGKAERRYARAWAWLEAVEGRDAALEAFAVPEKAEAVSRPPREEATVDRMGNVDNERIDPGMIQNRRTCPWYLDDLRERCALALGFLRFVKKDRESALSWYARVTALDARTRMLQRQGLWNNYTRLKWAAEHGLLNTYPEELRLYGGRMRFCVLMADFYYCTERFSKAAEVARRLLAGEFGELDARQDDYPLFLTATCLHWEKDRKGAYRACRKVLDDGAWTLTRDRAAFTAANLSWQIPDEKIMREGLALLKGLAESERENPFVHRARLVYGMRLLHLGFVEDGRRMLRRVPAASGGYRELAERILKAMQERKANRRKGEG